MASCRECPVSPSIFPQVLYPPRSRLHSPRGLCTPRTGWAPDTWTTLNTRSLLGGALLDQKKYADAEPLLLAGYEGLKKHEAETLPPGRVRLPEALERLVQFYEATGKKDQAARWRQVRDEQNARRNP
jgi:hypothetical protein